MAAGGGLTGNWGGIAQMLKAGMGGGKKVAIRRAAAYFSGQVKRNLTSGGRLAGAPFKPLEESTKKRRRKGKGKGKSTPLVDTGDMRNSVHPVVLDDNTAFIGIRRGEIGKSGEQMADIAEIHEFGTLSTKSIPARPFMRPVVKKFNKDAAEIFAKALEENFGSGGPTGGGLQAAVGALIGG